MKDFKCQKKDFCILSQRILGITEAFLIGVTLIRATSVIEAKGMNQIAKEEIIAQEGKKKQLRTEL